MKSGGVCLLLQCLIGLVICNTLPRIANYQNPGNHGVDHRDFLMKFGYLRRQGRTAVSQDDFRGAIRKFQRFYRIPETGQIDDTTDKVMQLPRCQLPDYNDEGGATFANFKVSGRRWDTKILTWRLNKVQGRYIRSELQNIVSNAVSEWKLPSLLEFVESPSSPATIDIDLVKPDGEGNHGDGAPFDSRTLAHAYFPADVALGGDVHVNMDQSYFLNTQTNQAFDLYSVLVHEVGHSLGLDHSEVEGSVMFPRLDPGAVFQGLHADDIAGIQSIYGANPLFAGTSKSTSSSQIKLTLLFTNFLCFALR